ncbi:MAG: pyridoxal-dependent decarboxylase [Candidatus Micrarchaeota archaeon]
MQTRRRGDLFSMGGIVPEEIAARMLHYAHRNLADADDFEVQRMLRELIRICGGDICKMDHWSGEDVGGVPTFSGTHSNELALQLSRDATGKNSVLMTNLAHSSVRRAAEKLRMRAIILDADPIDSHPGASFGSFALNPNRLAESLEHYGDDIAIIAIAAGTTDLGVCEKFSIPPEFLSSTGAWVHVDAAYGGMALGLLAREGEYPLPLYHGFGHCARSVTFDLHKFIGGYGCSLLLLSSAEDERLGMEERNYFRRRFTKVGSSIPADKVAAALATMKAYGLDGLRQIASDCHAKAKLVAERLGEHGIRTIVPVQSGIVSIALDSPQEANHMVKALEREGYSVASICIPGTDSEGTKYQINGIRITVRPGMDLERLMGFADAVIRIWSLQ